MGHTVPFKVMLQKNAKSLPLGSTSYRVPPPPTSTILGTSHEPVGLQEASIHTTTESDFIHCLCEAMTTVRAPSDGAALHVQLTNPGDGPPGGKGQSF